MSKNMQYRIMIDPGHGGEDDGAIGDISKEDQINLEYANCLYDRMLMDHELVPVMTRFSDEYVSLNDRVELALRYNCDFFVSIHANSFTSEQPHDSQVYFYSETKDKPLADSIFKYIDKVDGGTSKWSGVRYGNYQVLRSLNNEMPAVLIEIAFISNPEDEALMVDNDFRNAFVDAVYTGIKHFIDKN